MNLVQRVLFSNIGFPILVIGSSLPALCVMALANYGRGSVPGWHLPMSVFLVTMIGLAVRDLLKAERSRLLMADRVRRLPDPASRDRDGR